MQRISRLTQAVLLLVAALVFGSCSQVLPVSISGRINSTVVVDDAFFFDEDAGTNIFQGGHFANPYGWFKPFAVFDFPSTVPKQKSGYPFELLRR